MILPDHCHRALPVAHAGDLLVVKGLVDQLAIGSSLSSDQRGRFNLIIAELGNNLIHHTKGGVMLLRKFGGPSGLECICYDRGPGMADVTKALQDGEGTGPGLGLGLGAVRRLSDEFEIHSEPGVGTAVLARVRSVAPDAPTEFQFGAVMIPMPGMDYCGDGWTVTVAGLVAVIDGLGHGKDASVAARRAEATAAQGYDDPRRAIEAMHLALRGTRGAVAMVIVADATTIRYSGIGNISAALVGVGRVTGLTSSWGVVGSNARSLGMNEVAWGAGDVLLLNSDGIVRAADTFVARRLRYVDPTLAAAILLRDATSRLDDQTVVVMRLPRSRTRVGSGPPSLIAS